MIIEIYTHTRNMYRQKYFTFKIVTQEWRRQYKLVGLSRGVFLVLKKEDKCYHIKSKLLTLFAGVLYETDLLTLLCCVRVFFCPARNK